MTSVQIVQKAFMSFMMKFNVSIVDIASMDVICKSDVGLFGIASSRRIRTTSDGSGKELGMNVSKMAHGSVFLVEDEVMIRMMVADMLEELGYSVAAESGDINEAVKLAQTTEFDIAILDVNVNGKVISPVAEAIQARNRPFIFATGYGAQGLPEEFRDRPTLQKPFQMETLAAVLGGAMKGLAA